MKYDELLNEACNNDLLVKEKPLRAYRGRIKGNKIAIKSDLTNVEKCCVLAEELGHFHTNAGDILDQTNINNRKQERVAREWAYQKLISVSKVNKALKYGVYNHYELAEFLEVTEEFLNAAIRRYEEKHGKVRIVNGRVLDVCEQAKGEDESCRLRKVQHR